MKDGKQKERKTGDERNGEREETGKVGKGTTQITESVSQSVRVLFAINSREREKTRDLRKGSQGKRESDNERETEGKGQWEKGEG